jgi:uncharacterized coiled-coil protein SlyX
MDSILGRQVPPTPAYQVPTQSLGSSSHSTLEDSLKAFIQFSNQTISEVKNATLVNTQSINEVKNATMVNSQAIAKMEVQLRKMANQLGEREKGKLPRKPVPNPRLQFQGEVYQILCRDKSMFKPLSHLGQGDKWTIKWRFLKRTL